MKRPWLSVLIPAHNPGIYLAEALDSVLGQVDDQVEVLVFDDASTDGTADLVAQRVAAAGRVGSQLRLLPSDGATALGVSAARNALLEAAQGQWLWFLDADDRLRPHALARVRSLVESEPGLQAIVVDHAVLRVRATLKHRLRGEGHRRSMQGPGGAVRPPATLMPRLLARGQWHVWGKVVRRDAWPAELRFPAGRVFEDLSVVPRLMGGLHPVWYLDTPLVDYRSNPSSILGSMNVRKLQDWARALEDLVDHPGFDRHWADFVVQQALRLRQVEQRLGARLDERDAWWALLCRRQPLLQPILKGWVFRPRRWVSWLKARGFGWTQADHGHGKGSTGGQA